MSKEPLNLPTPILIAISVSSILLLLYLSLYAISQETKHNKPSTSVPYAEDIYNPGSTTDFLSHPTENTLSEERELRNAALSNYEKMNLETEEQLQRQKIDRDFSSTQRSLSNF